MNEMRLDPVLADWLGDGPEQGSEHGRDRALAAVHKVDQRPGWTFPRWWLPAPIADVGLRVPRQAALALLVLTLLALLALAVAVGGRLSLAPLVLEPTDSVIAFADGGVIYVVKPDGSDRQRLSTSQRYATAPVFSLDGSAVAYLVSDGPNQPFGSLVIESVDGTAPRVEVSQGMQVLSSDVPNFSWSSDSRRIAFSAVDGANAQIFVVDRDGTGLRAISDGTEQSDLPSWSPVGTWSRYIGDWISYRVSQPDQSQVSFERVHPDGSGLEVVAGVIGTGANLSKLTWSPPDPDFPGSHVGSYAMNAGFGSQSRAVIDMGVGHALDIWTDGVGGFEDAPVPWSPNARFLAFISANDGVIVADRDRTSDLYDGELQRLGPVVDCWVDWSPDSTFLYGGSPNGCAGVVVIPLANPTAATTLTDASGMASWRPIPRD